MKKDVNLENTKIIFESITGSVSRGTNVEGSDEDRKGIFLTNKENLFHLEERKETICIHEPEDREYHSLHKFMALASMKSNPTVLEMLFTEDRFITKKHPIMDILIDNRELFLTQDCYYSFYGYAKDQLMRIKNAKLDVTKEEHTEHLDYVVKRVLRNVPDRYDVFSNNDNSISLSNVSYSDNDKHKIYLNLNVENGEFTQLFGMLNELRNVLQTYNSITGRNKKADEKRLWKHAMQLVVLLKMGIEILSGEGLQVYREKDRDELLKIRNGELRWSDFYLYVEELILKLENTKKLTLLPPKADLIKLNKIYQNMMEQYYYSSF